MAHDFALFANRQVVLGIGPVELMAAVIAALVYLFNADRSDFRDAADRIYDTAEGAGEMTRRVVSKIEEDPPAAYGVQLLSQDATPAGDGVAPAAQRSRLQRRRPQGSGTWRSRPRIS